MENDESVNRLKQRISTKKDAKCRTQNTLTTEMSKEDSPVQTILKALEQHMIYGVRDLTSQASLQSGDENQLI